MATQEVAGRAALARALGTGMSESDFQREVIAYAKARGWRVAHFRPARTAKGYRTAMQGHVGFPDLVLARAGRVLHVELKAERGQPTADQVAWGAALGASWRLWRPDAWFNGTIEGELA